MHIHIYMMLTVIYPCKEILPAFHEQSSDGLRLSLLPPNTSSNDPTTDMYIYMCVIGVELYTQIN